MITVVDQKTYDMRGLSTDTKPTDSWVGNGSTFFEIDTGNVYVYDRENHSWVQI